MKLKHHKFRFGLIGNLKVLLCRIFGHRVSEDPIGFACERCNLAYEEIYSPGYWKAMIEWMKPKPENVETKELVSALVDELMKHMWFPSTEHQVDLFERCAPYLDIPDMPQSLNHPPIFPERETILDDSEPNFESIVKDIAEGMIGIGGIPSANEFYSEFDFRLRAALFGGSEPIGEETVDEYLDDSEAYKGIRSRAIDISSQVNQFIADCGGDSVDALNIALARLDLAERKFITPFDEAIKLLRAIADLQNGPPLEKYREEWEAVMSDVHEFLHEHETSTDE
jgi:hypothetical protein